MFCKEQRKGTDENGKKYILIYKTHRKPDRDNNNVATKTGIAIYKKVNIDSKILVLRYNNSTSKYEKAGEIKLKNALGESKAVSDVLEKLGLGKYYSIGHGNQITFDSMNRRFYIPWSPGTKDLNIGAEGKIYARGAKAEAEDTKKQLTKLAKYVVSFQLKTSSSGAVSITSVKVQDVSSIFTSGKTIVLNGLSVGGCAGVGQRYIYAMIDKGGKSLERIIVRAIIKKNDPTIYADNSSSALKFNIQTKGSTILKSAGGSFKEPLRKFEKSGEDNSAKKVAGEYVMPSYVMTYKNADNTYSDRIYTGRWIEAKGAKHSKDHPEIYMANYFAEYEVANNLNGKSVMPSRVWYLSTHQDAINSTRGDVIRGEMEALFVNGNGSLFLVYNSPNDNWSAASKARPNNKDDMPLGKVYRLTNSGFPATDYYNTCSGDVTTNRNSPAYSSNTTTQSATQVTPGDPKKTMNNSIGKNGE